LAEGRLEAKKGPALMPGRCFPPPWSVDDPDTKLERQCSIVRDQAYTENPAETMREKPA
jgi:hypothetical protein